jgi:chemotaxis protein CheD
MLNDPVTVSSRFQQFSSTVNDTTEIAPCTLSVIRERGGFRTVVGSGISVCLFDRRNRIAGMNHFLFPRVADPLKATGRYGNAALIGLLQLLTQSHPAASPVAYIAGGAYCDEFEIDSALENIRIAWQFLFVKKIPIISQHIGGSHFREVRFDVATGVFTARNFRVDGT